MTEFSKTSGSQASYRLPASARVLCEEVHELDAFENDLAITAGEHAPLRLQVPTPGKARSTIHRWWISAGGFAVAASLLAVLMLNRQHHPHPINPSDGTNIADAGSNRGRASLPVAVPQDSPLASDTHATVLLTIVEGSDPTTGLPCASCRTVDLIASVGNEQRLIAHSEPAMIQDAMNRTCSPSARRVVVVGLTGPSKSLPSTEAQATQLAQCIMTAPGASSPDGDANLISNAASACMPANVAVQVWAGSR